MSNYLLQKLQVHWRQIEINILWRLKGILEYVYFKLFIEEPGQDTVVQIFLKVICLEDDSVFYDKYILHHLEADTYACWNGIGFNQKGKWKAGLYKYSLRVGTGSVYEGTFTVY